MAGNANSGRRPRKDEDRRRLGKLYPKAISYLESCLCDETKPDHVRLGAAIEVIQQKIGKPKQESTVKVNMPKETFVLIAGGEHKTARDLRNDA